MSNRRYSGLTLPAQTVCLPGKTFVDKLCVELLIHCPCPCLLTWDLLRFKESVHDLSGLSRRLLRGIFNNSMDG